MKNRAELVSLLIVGMCSDKSDNVFGGQSINKLCGIIIASLDEETCLATLRNLERSKCVLLHTSIDVVCGLYCALWRLKDGSPLSAYSKIQHITSPVAALVLASSEHREYYKILFRETLTYKNGNIHCSRLAKFIEHTYDSLQSIAILAHSSLTIIRHVINCLPIELARNASGFIGIRKQCIRDIDAAMESIKNNDSSQNGRKYCRNILEMTNRLLTSNFIISAADMPGELRGLWSHIEWDKVIKEKSTAHPGMRRVHPTINTILTIPGTCQCVTAYDRVIENVLEWLLQNAVYASDNLSPNGPTLLVSIYIEGSYVSIELSNKSRQCDYNAASRSLPASSALVAGYGWTIDSKYSEDCIHSVILKAPILNPKSAYLSH